MPRTTRLDMAGLLQHVIVRGIERRDIFMDDVDRTLFVERFTELLLETGTECLAWALMPNHFHLLLRPQLTKLAIFMRRLLTSYAISFNLRHNRSGHLFQNRYKSIVCQEDAYLLELVRYIHLNPIRAGLVESVDILNNYRWSGHAVIMGNMDLAAQKTDEVLYFFDQRKKSAREKYRDFVADGIRQGHREELTGGGLRRSLKRAGPGTCESSDERVLGNGEFVEQVWRDAESHGCLPVSMPLEEIIRCIAQALSLEPQALRQRSKVKELADARGAICYIAVRKMGYNGADVAKALNISRSGVSVAARRGDGIIEGNRALQKIFEG